jgi:hypothetical protein
MYGMGLCHFQLGVAFGAGKDFALFHFVLVQVDFSVAFRALRHVTRLLPKGAFTQKRIIYRGCQALPGIARDENKP